MKRSCRVGAVFVDHATLVADFIPFKGHDHILTVFEFDDMGKVPSSEEIWICSTRLLWTYSMLSVSSPLGKGHHFTRHHGHGIGFNSSGRV